MNWRAALGLTLLAAAIVSGWSAWRMRGSDAPTAGLAQRSDYVLRDFELVGLGSDGTESMRLLAPRLQRGEDQSMDITTPLFMIPGSGGTWQVRAEHGWVSPDAELARLEGGVSGRSDPDAGPPTTFDTASLELLPDQDLARTRGQVTLTQPGIIQTGTGLEANLKTRQYRLLSQVRTRYEPSASR